MSSIVQKATALMQENRLDRTVRENARMRLRQQRINEYNTGYMYNEETGGIDIRENSPAYLKQQQADIDAISRQANLDYIQQEKNAYEIQELINQNKQLSQQIIRNNTNHGFQYGLNNIILGKEQPAEMMNNLVNTTPQLKQGLEQDGITGIRQINLDDNVDLNVLSRNGITAQMLDTPEKRRALEQSMIAFTQNGRTEIAGVLDTMMALGVSGIPQPIIEEYIQMTQSPFRQQTQPIARETQQDDTMGYSARGTEETSTEQQSFSYQGMEDARRVDEELPYYARVASAFSSDKPLENVRRNALALQGEELTQEARDVAIQSGLAQDELRAVQTEQQLRINQQLADQAQQNINIRKEELSNRRQESRVSEEVARMKENREAMKDMSSYDIATSVLPYSSNYEDLPKEDQQEVLKATNDIINRYQEENKYSPTQKQDFRDLQRIIGTLSSVEVGNLGYIAKTASGIAPIVSKAISDFIGYDLSGDNEPAVRAKIQSIQNALIRQQSGQAVTKTELERTLKAFGSSFPEFTTFKKNLAGYKTMLEEIRDKALVETGSTKAGVSNISKVVFGRELERMDKLINNADAILKGTSIQNGVVKLNGKQI